VLALSAARFVYKHSRLAGSTDLEDWGNQGKAAVTVSVPRASAAAAPARR
jgi:hypothetical protein